MKTIKRDYIYLADLPDADTVLRLIPTWIDDYNENQPHKGLKHALTPAIPPASNQLKRVRFFGGNSISHLRSTNVVDHHQSPSRLLRPPAAATGVSVVPQRRAAAHDRPHLGLGRTAQPLFVFTVQRPALPRRRFDRPSESASELIENDADLRTGLKLAMGDEPDRELQRGETGKHLLDARIGLADGLR